MLAKPAPKGLAALGGVSVGVEYGIYFFIFLFIIIIAASIVFAFAYHGKAINAIGTSLSSSFIGIFIAIGNGVHMIFIAFLGIVYNDIVKYVVNPIMNLFNPLIQYLKGLGL